MPPTAFPNVDSRGGGGGGGSVVALCGKAFWPSQVSGYAPSEETRMQRMRSLPLAKKVVE
mgnify:CR=1 FL=1